MCFVLIPLSGITSLMLFFSTTIIIYIFEYLFIVVFVQRNKYHLIMLVKSIGSVVFTDAINLATKTN